jgi:uncharacterized protein (TIGR02246 family)
MQNDAASRAMTDEARVFLGTWVDMFNTRDPEKLLALYADDATLHGTSQAQLYVGIEQIRTYFRGASTVKLGQQVLQALSDTIVLAVGKYEFTRVIDGRPTVSPARFTFVLRRDHGGWRMLHHHSSLEPKS